MSQAGGAKLLYNVRLLDNLLDHDRFELMDVITDFNSRDELYSYVRNLNPSRAKKASEVICLSYDPIFFGAFFPLAFLYPIGAQVFLGVSHAGHYLNEWRHKRKFKKSFTTL